MAVIAACGSHLSSCNGFSAQIPATDLSHPCAQLAILSPEPIDFSDLEHRLICGDSKVAAWAEPSQITVKIFLVSFLQSRGYFQPTFLIQDDGVLFVETGEKSHIYLLRSKSMPEGFDFDRFWVPTRKIMTPSLLDEYTNLVKGRLEHAGYPCPTVTTTANAKEGSMDIEADVGSRLRVKTIREEPTSGLASGVVKRYLPYSEGDWFDGDLMYLGNERIKAEGVLASSYMTSHCRGGEVFVEHRASQTPPRLVRVGVGVNTETFFLVKASYRNHRVDDHASQFEANFQGHYFSQKVDGAFKWYFLNPSSSLHFEPHVEFKRHYEKLFENYSAKASWHLGGYKDFWGHHWQTHLGPSLKLIRTVRGEGPNFARVVAMDYRLNVESHDHELYRAAPRSGRQFEFRFSHTIKDLSTLDVKTIASNGEALFNVRSLEPPLFILGIRGGAATSQAHEGTRLPSEYRHTLGGSMNIRGFHRRSIPGSEGAMTSAYLGAEGRLVTILPYGLQPFVFVDVGRVGEESYKLDSQVFYSPGVGVRWQSPFGSLRANIGHGFTGESEKSEGLKYGVRPTWVLFISFGEEF